MFLYGAIQGQPGSSLYATCKALHCRWLWGLTSGMCCSKAKPWMDSFIAKVGSGNKPNGLALHYYGTDSSACISWLTEMHTRYNLDVWVTEVASTSSNLQSVQSFQAAVVAWADQTTWVKGLFWFAASRTANQNPGLSQSALMGPDGSKLDLGYRYCYN